MKIAIVGAGRMGIGIATALLLSGQDCRIALVDLKERKQGEENHALNRAVAEIRANLSLLHELGVLEGSADRLLSGLSMHRELGQAVTGCEFVFEAVPEKPDLKRALIGRMEPLLEEDAIIASATSTIDLPTFWEAARRPERIVTAHWLNPAFIIPLVEVSTGEKTSAEAAEKTRRFLIQAGKIPVMIKDSPGFIVPRIQVAAMNEAVRIVEEGVASPEDVDTAIKAGFGFRLAVLGLIEFIDLGGLDILFHASRFLYERFGRDQYRPLETIVEKMEKGEVGPRSGRGFYDYSTVDREAMFMKRYRGFVELLKLINGSGSLTLRGGIREE
jgi:3-hydroxybutyryl-CoA dehydrogenase